MRVLTPKKKPSFLLPLPEPREDERKFNRQIMMGWRGHASLHDLEGWLENPRIEVPIQLWIEQHAGRQPSNDDLLEILIDESMGEAAATPEDGDELTDGRKPRKNRLLALAEDIRINGIRQPLIIGSDKRILDGNRRYFASLYLYKTSDPRERESFTEIPVWVVPESAGPSDIDNVMVEMNFVEDHRVPWNYGVIGKHIYDDYSRGKSVDELAQKYRGWSKSRINTVIEARKLAERFIEHNDGSLEAEDLAYRHLIWFDQLRRSNSKHLDKQEFRETIFDLLMDDRSPFRRTKDFERLHEVYDNPEAWATLKSNDSPDVVKDAVFIVDRDDRERRTSAEARLQRVNQMLGGLLQDRDLLRVEPRTFEQFHRIAAKMPGAPSDPEGRAKLLAELLDQLTSREVAELPQDLVGRLEGSLTRVIKQATASREA